MNKMMKECTKPHALAHSVSGFGVAFIVLALVPALAAHALIIGIVVLVVGVAWDFMVNK